jgi:hypothetical protein
MKRWVKKIFLSLLGIVFSTVLIMASVLVWTLKNPEPAWKWAEAHFFPDDLKITWQDISFSVRPQQNWNFAIDWKIQGLQVQKSHPMISLPIDAIGLNLDLDWKRQPRLLVFHRFHLQASEDLRFSPVQEKSQEPTPDPFEQAENILSKIRLLQKWVHFEQIHISIPNLELPSLTISLSADQKNALEAASLKSLVNLSLEKEKFRITFGGDLWLNSEDSRTLLSGNLKLNGLGLDSTQAIEIRAHSKRLVLNAQGPATYQLASNARLKLKPELQVELKPDSAEVQLLGEVQGIPGPLARIQNLNAQATIPFEKARLWAKQASRFAISAPLELFFIDAKMRKPFEASCRCKIPETLKFEAQGSAWLSHLLSPTEKRETVLDANMSLESLENRLLLLHFKSHLKMEKENTDLFYLPALEASAKIQSFQGLRQILDAKNILVPAPFDILDGPLALEINGPARFDRKNGFAFPAVFTTDLKSEGQAVQTITNGEVLLDPRFKSAQADVHLRITSLQLQLPPLDPVLGKPRLLPDSRILRKPRKTTQASAGFQFRLNLEAETETPGAIRLLSKYFDPYLPLTLQIRNNSKNESSGFIRTEPFDVEYLRRRVRVQKFSLDLKSPEPGLFPVDGRLRIRQTHYTVFITVKGTVKKPNIILSSQPELPRSEIISVLLYDRTSDQLVSADAAAAGGVEAAMADRAIGLLGLWAFATTPIKSFSYNPATHQYSATVSLSDDVIAGVGTNWEQTTRLELRKRISRQWMVTADWTPATQEEDANSRLVLQWERRFE